MRVLLSALCLLAFGGFGRADDKKVEPKEDKKDEKKDDKKPLTVKEKIAELSKEMNALSQETNKKFQEAKTKEEKDTLREEFMAGQTKFGEKLLALAKDNAQDEAAFEATMTAVGMRAKGATEYLLATFVDDARITKAIPLLGQGPNGQKNLAMLAEKSKSKDVQGAAKFAAVSSEIESIDTPEDDKPLPEKVTAEKFAAATVKLAAIVKEYGDVKTADNRGKSATIADAAKKVTFFMEHLCVGKMAPDTECDLLEDGKKAKLSDYRGNVVVLDIWATWCGPCRAMIPHEREMVKKLESKKFKLVSVSADAKKETLTKFLEKEEMPWTHWWAGAKGGLTEEYQVRFYPSLYIIDGKGVIRAKHLRGDDLEKFVEKLLTEAGPK